MQQRLLPAGSVTKTITLVYSAIPTAAAPSGLVFANHAFSLQAYDGATLLSGFTFQQPISLTLYYSNADVAGLNESALSLDYWDGSNWVDVATTCSPPSTYERHPDANWLRVPFCHLSDFALFGPSRQKLYLPLIEQ